MFNDHKELNYFINNFDSILIEIDNAVTSNNLKKIRQMAYDYINIGYNSRTMIDRTQYKLYPMFQDQTTPLSMIAVVLKDLLQSVKKRLESNLIEPEPKEPERPPAWNTINNSEPDQWITIIHGGELQFLMSFLSGQSKGYPLEYQKTAKGIQVRPMHESREEHFQHMQQSCKFYARSSSAERLGYPVYLTAKIKAQYLDSAPNIDEAGLRFCYISELKNIHIELISQQKNYFTEIVPMHLQHQLAQITSISNNLPIEEESSRATYNCLYQFFKQKSSPKTTYELCDKVFDYIP